MVYITSEDGKEKKFACIKCIKGHRSSKCNHTNRELFEIKKKGRPVSQCESCRQLRKTKQIHIKCMCHLNVKLKDTLNNNSSNNNTTTTAGSAAAVDEGFRHSDLSVNGTSASPTAPPLVNSCFQCDRPTLYCICKKDNYGTSNSNKQTNDVGYMSSNSSDGSVTPPVYQLSYPERRTYSAGLNHINTTTTTTITTHNNNNNNNNDSKIQIYSNPPSPLNATSPTNSITTPTTSTGKNNPSLRHLTIPIHDPSDDIDSDTPIYKSHEENTTLGEFTNTSSEELMDQIYSGFIGNKDGKTPSSSTSSPLLREADHQLAELSKED